MEDMMMYSGEEGVVRDELLAVVLIADDVEEGDGI
jgi:hypothetical protein